MSGPEVTRADAEQDVDPPDDDLPGCEPASPAPTFLARGQTIGRYVIVECLGVGGMGVVYSAWDPKLDRKLAIKLVRVKQGASGGTRGRNRLLREAQALARVRHPNVITVHDVGAHEGRVFVAMEFVEGITLQQWLERRPERPYRELLDIFLQAGRGLAAAHRAGIVHRDFKPENVMIGSDGRVLVLDFGIARGPWASDDEPSGVGEQDTSVEDLGPSERVEDGMTRPGGVVGTPGYMSPEQRRRRPLDGRSDQFSFCVALWEALAGEHPFTGGTARARYESILAGPCIVPRVPRAIVRALSRGLSPEPADRFPSLDTLLDLLAKPMPRRRTAAEQGRTLLTAAGLALTFALGLGLAPEGVRTAEADSTMVRVKAADHALELAHDRIFDKDFDAARSAYAKAYRIISAAPLRERREFIPRMQLVAEMFEHAGKGNYAAAIYNDAALTAEAVGIDPAPFIGLRDRAMSAEMRR